MHCNVCYFYRVIYLLNQMLIFIFIGTLFCVSENQVEKTLNKFGHLHKCQYCDYNTSHSTSLKNHILTHTGERPFACSICSYRSNQKANLRRHLLLKHHRTDGIWFSVVNYVLKCYFIISLCLYVELLFRTLSNTNFAKNLKILKL